jgi:hypothetical protein
MMHYLLFSLVWICLNGANPVVQEQVSLSLSSGQDSGMEINWWAVNPTGLLFAESNKWFLSGCVAASPIGIMEPDRYYGLVSGFWASEFQFSVKPAREGLFLTQTERRFKLYQNYPNPFRKTTRITYELPERGPVSLVIYDNSGRMVRTLMNGWQNAGRCNINWNGKDDFGRECASGVYFYSIKTTENADIKKMIIAK